MALTPIQQIRTEIGDTDINFPFLTDDVYEYYLLKHHGSIARASLDAAKAILFQLSTRSGTDTVDIFSVKNTSSESYRYALELYIKSPHLNPLSSNLLGWVGGVSKLEMELNNSNLDNNQVVSPTKDRELYNRLSFYSFK